MTYKARMTKKNDSALRFADWLDATNKLTPDPIKEIKVGYTFYNELLEYTNTLPLKPDKSKRILGSLYGVKILIDPELKPNEYKVITAT